MTFFEALFACTPAALVVALPACGSRSALHDAAGGAEASPSSTSSSTETPDAPLDPCGDMSGGAGGFGAPVIAADGTVYDGTIYTAGHSLSAVTPDGATQWTMLDIISLWSPVIGPDGDVYAGATDGLRAILSFSRGEPSAHRHAPIFGRGRAAVV